MIPVVGWLSQKAVELITGASEANEKYAKFLPVLRTLIAREGRQSPHVETMFEEIGDLASFGARRTNFRRYYIDDPDGWKRLPDDPKNFPYGFWQ